MSDDIKWELEYSYPSTYCRLPNDIAWSNVPANLGKLTNRVEDYVDGERMTFVTYQFPKYRDAKEARDSVQKHFKECADWDCGKRFTTEIRAVGKEETEGTIGSDAKKPDA